MRITGPIKMIEALNMFNKALGVLEYISYIKSNQIWLLIEYQIVKLESLLYNYKN